ncbi:4350_t:CDS:1, partial [Gigaspora margarita]
NAPQSYDLTIFFAKKKRAIINAMMPEQRSNYFKQKFLDKQSFTFFKKHGRPPTSSERKK